MRPRLIVGRGPAVLSLLLMTLSACSPSSESPPSATPSSSAEVGASGLPSGCEAIDLEDPNGERLDLSGEWTGTSWFSGASEAERTFVLQLGDCIWITITDARFHANPVPGASVLGVLRGELGRDLSITGDLVTLLRDAPVGGFSDQQMFAAVRLLIAFDADGDAILREDREPEVNGPRCTHPPSACPDPVELRRAGSAGPG